MGCPSAMLNSRAQNALGLSRRAGKCIAGDFAAERAVKAKEALLVVVDHAASEATRKKYRTIAATNGVQYLELSGVGAAIGKQGGKIAAITDQGFADMIVAAANNKD